MNQSRVGQWLLAMLVLLMMPMTMWAYDYNYYVELKGCGENYIFGYKNGTQTEEKWGVASGGPTVYSTDYGLMITLTQEKNSLAITSPNDASYTGYLEHVVMSFELDNADGLDVDLFVLDTQSPTYASTQVQGSFQQDDSGQWAFVPEVPVQLDNKLIQLVFNNTSSQDVRINKWNLLALQIVSEYGLAIGDTRVTPANKKNIDGNGKLSFDPETNTLTINGYTEGGDIWTDLTQLTINIAQTSRVGRIYWSGQLIENAGTLMFKREANAQAELTIEATGVNAAESAISGFRAVGFASSDDDYAAGTNVEPAKVFGAEYNTTRRAFVNGDDLVTKVIVTPMAYPLWIGDTQATLLNSSRLAVRYDNSQNEITSLSYDNSTATLTMDNYNGYEPIIAQYYEFNISLIGNNAITIEDQNKPALKVGSADNSTLTFMAGDTEYCKLELVSVYVDPVDGFEGQVYHYENDLILTTTTNDIYNIWTVAPKGYGLMLYTEDEQEEMIKIEVNKGNAGNVLGDGTVSYDKATNTLTLNNASFGSTSAALQYSGTEDLTIHLLGSNLMKSYEGLIYYWPEENSQVQTLPKLFFTTDADKPGMLKTTCNEVGMLWNDDSFSEVSYPAGFVLSTYGNECYYALSKAYNLWIAYNHGQTEEQIRVTDANSDAVISTQSDENTIVNVSFNGSTNTLTLNNFNYNSTTGTNSVIEVGEGLTNLNVYLKGENTVYKLSGSYGSLYSNQLDENATLTFTTSSSDLGSLSYNGTDKPFVRFGDMNNSGGDCDWVYCKNNLRCDVGYTDGYASYSADIYVQNINYGITVYTSDNADGVKITSYNQSDVLNDGGSVKFNGHNRLTLNNASLSYISIPDDLLPEDGLEVMLLGNNSFTNGGMGAICHFSQNNETIPMTFMGNSTGKLTYLNTLQPGTDFNPPTPVVGNAFPGFTLNYQNNLIGYVQDLYVIVGTTMNPIVDDDGRTGVGTETDIDYSLMEPNVVLKQIVINNVLYTLADNGTTASDGLDQTTGEVVLNSVMTDQQVRELAMQPSTSSEYANAFKGLTFMVPAGTGEITVKAYTADGHALHVMIGTQDPVEVKTTHGNGQVIQYAVTEQTYVYIYHVEVADAGTSEAPQMATSAPRIGPKTSVSTGLQGLNVSASMVSNPPAADDYAMMDPAKVQRLGGGSHGIVVSDADATDIPNGAFTTTSSAPALAPRTGGSENISFIDLRQTKVTGKEFKHGVGAFEGVPASTLIYLPAGNSVLDDDANFVIGGICNKMELNTASETSFEVRENFTAGTAKIELPIADNQQTATIYLPFGVANPDEYGDFYELNMMYDGNKGINVKPVKGALQPNKPYIFVAKAKGKVTLSQHSALVEKLGSAAPAALKGSYEKQQPANAFKFVPGTTMKGTFEKLSTGDILPFTAYVESNAGGESLTLTWGGDLTGEGKISITDAVGVVNKILNGEVYSKANLPADVNGDYNISITDAVGVVNIILGSGASSAPALNLDADPAPEVEPE